MDKETGGRLAIAVARTQRVLPPDPAAYFSMPGHDA